MENKKSLRTFMIISWIIAVVTVGLEIVIGYYGQDDSFIVKSFCSIIFIFFATCGPLLIACLSPFVSKLKEKEKINWTIIPLLIVIVAPIFLFIKFFLIG